MKKNLEVKFVPLSMRTPVVGHVIQVVIKRRGHSFVVVEYEMHGNELRECLHVINGCVQDAISYRQQTNYHF